MLQFIKRLFGIKAEKRDERMVVRNLNTQNSSNTGQGATPKSTPQKPSTQTERYFYIRRSEIAAMTDDEKGLITSIKLKDKANFEEIIPDGKALVSDKKQGVSKVIIHVELPLDSNNATLQKLTQILDDKQTIAILRFDKQGLCTILGEHNGLVIQSVANGKVVMSGEENDAFYKVDVAAAKAVLKL